MPKNKSKRIVIDTNLWISFIISKKLKELDAILFSNQAKLLFSIELIQEIEATMLKPKLKKYFKKDSLEEMLDIFDEYIDFVKVKSKINVCRDPKDDFLLSLAIDGKADFLITGDKDLLVLGKMKSIQIITMSEYIEKNNR